MSACLGVVPTALYCWRPLSGSQGSLHLCTSSLSQSLTSGRDSRLFALPTDGLACLVYAPLAVHTLSSAATASQAFLPACRIDRCLPVLSPSSVSALPPAGGGHLRRW